MPKPISPEKMQQLLLKVRKGATASFNWPMTSAVLSHLGGSVEPIVGLVQVKGSVMVSKSKVAAARDDLAKHLVRALPTVTKVGQVYITKIGAPVVAYGGEYESFEYEGAVGAEGWLVTAPDGRTFTVLPGEYDVGGPSGSGKGQGWLSRPRARVHAYDLWDWLLKEIGVKDLAAHALGVESHVPAAQRTRANTGTCGVCFKNVKLSSYGGFIVLHGYKRPGWGSVHGRCPGTDRQPFETSPEATEIHLRTMTYEADELAHRLHALESGAVVQLPGVTHQSTVSQGQPGWDWALKQAIDAVKRQIQWLNETRAVFADLIAKWRQRALPIEGGIEINWYVEGRK